MKHAPADQTERLVSVYRRLIKVIADVIWYRDREPDGPPAGSGCNPPIEARSTRAASAGGCGPVRLAV